MTKALSSRLNCPITAFGAFRALNLLLYPVFSRLVVHLAAEPEMPVSLPPLLPVLLPFLSCIARCGIKPPSR